MKATYHLDESAETTLNRIEERLKEDGYLYTCGELNWEFRVQDGTVSRELTMCEFWARKSLAPKYRDYYFIEISGTVRRPEEGSGCTMEVEFVELHHNRPHTGGGGASLNEMLDYFSGIVAATETLR